MAAALGLLLLGGCSTAIKPSGDPMRSKKGSSGAYKHSNDPLRSKTRAGESYDDLWERIRAGFAMPDLSNDLVAEREAWYASRPEYLARTSGRASKYLFHVVEELERRDMPLELALLPFVESSFNPQAVSSAKAMGMWQFMPATGKTFDLKQNMFRDDRRDVLASTRAALDYLQKLHGMFGDWHLVLAAYNWGEGSVARAIAKNKRAGLPTGYSDLTMPMETRLYVPKLQALKNLIQEPARFGARLPAIANHPYFDSVVVTRDIDVALAAKLAEVSLKDFMALNPAMNKPVILAASKQKILLPWDNATVFQRNLELHAGQLASWTTWVAPKNMTATEVAARFEMSEAELRKINNIPSKMLIKAGSTVLVARPADHEFDIQAHVLERAQLAYTPEEVFVKTTVRAGKKDTVATIANRYQQPEEKVAQWNAVTLKAKFKPGDHVVLHLPQDHAHFKPAASRPQSSSKKPRT